MEKQSYLSALERQFQKSEYISIAKKSYLMFTLLCFKERGAKRRAS